MGIFSDTSTNVSFATCRNLLSLFLTDTMNAIFRQERAVITLMQTIAAAAGPENHVNVNATIRSEMSVENKAIVSQLGRWTVDPIPSPEGTCRMFWAILLDQA
jgi:hypothetical protein